jgi:transcriptional regulator with XRE-family HTH domain
MPAATNFRKSAIRFRPYVGNKTLLGGHPQTRARGEEMRKKHVDPAAGRRLSEVRQHRGISQSELAKRIGVKVGTIQGYEHARISISATRLEQLATGLQCEPADLARAPGAPMPRYTFHARRRGAAAVRTSQKARSAGRFRLTLSREPLWTGLIRSNNGDSD